MQKVWEFIQKPDVCLSSERQMKTIIIRHYNRMYPAFSDATGRLLLLHVGTATARDRFLLLTAS